MSSKILINALDPEECRIAKVKNNKLEEFHFETAAKEITKGNIYKAIISRVEPGLQAVFIDYGAEKHGFLQKQEIHSDYYLDNRSGDRSLKNIVRRGQELLVQVIKDPLMNKGAMLSTFISLPGRNMVLMPGSNNRGVSRKIVDDDERKRLKNIVSSLKLGEGFGVIVRTAGNQSTKADLSKDLSYLMRLWKNINSMGMGESAPVLLYKERDLVVRSIRDYFTPDITEILVDNLHVFNEVRSFIRIISPKHTHIIKRYKGAKPIFAKYQLEDQIASIFENKVKLKTGGSVVLEQTEALVAIDVNSGKATKKGSLEETALETNLEAAEEISRQLRLRDLGGLIVIDFIDMRDVKNKLKVEKSMRNCLKEDKARTKVGRISKFGLMEMSRQRIRQSLELERFEECENCMGKGLVMPVDAQVLGFLRKLRLKASANNDIKVIKGVVPKKVAYYLLNRKRDDILNIEARHNLSINIEGDIRMVPGESNILCEK